MPSSPRRHGPLPRSARASRSLERKLLTNKVYVRPVPGPVTQWYNPHPGIDIAPPFGTPIGAAHSGIVTFVGWQDGYGMHVEVTQADGYVTTYSHMSAFSVKVGQLVVAGQQLGNVGSTATPPARTCTSRSTCPTASGWTPRSGSTSTGSFPKDQTSP